MTSAQSRWRTWRTFIVPGAAGPVMLTPYPCATADRPDDETARGGDDAEAYLFFPLVACDRCGRTVRAVTRDSWRRVSPGCGEHAGGTVLLRYGRTASTGWRRQFPA